MHLDTDLTGTTLHLLSRNLGTSTTSTDRLDLVGLADLSLGLLLLLALGDGGLAGGSTNLGLLVAAGVDLVERSTDDTTLVLDGLARALLGDLLGHTLLAKTTVSNGPGDLTGVLALQEEGLILGADKAEDLMMDNGVGAMLTDENVNKSAADQKRRRASRFQAKRIRREQCVRRASKYRQEHKPVLGLCTLF